MPGGRAYSGHLRGPYMIAVRSRIPPDVLRQVQTDSLVLCLGFGVGIVGQVTLSWALVEFDELKPLLPRERKILWYGGD